MQNPPALSPAVTLSELKKVARTPADKKILALLGTTEKKIAADLEQYRFGHAAHLVYAFFWHQYADVYIEKSKRQIEIAKTKKEAAATKKILLGTHMHILKLLHPFTPFITEELWQHLPLKKKGQLVIEAWPGAS